LIPSSDEDRLFLRTVSSGKRDPGGHHTGILTGAAALLHQLGAQE
jgi:hypothetical protein